MQDLLPSKHKCNNFLLSAQLKIASSSSTGMSSVIETVVAGQGTLNSKSCEQSIMKTSVLLHSSTA